MPYKKIEFIYSKSNYISIHKIVISVINMTVVPNNFFLDILSTNIKPNKIIWLAHEGDLHFGKAYIKYFGNEKQSKKDSIFLLISKQLFDSTKTINLIKNFYIFHHFKHPAILPLHLITISPNNTLDSYYSFPENGKLSDYIGFSHENCISKFTNLTPTIKSIISYGIAHALRYIYQHKYQFNQVNARCVYLNEKFYPFLTNFYSIYENNEIDFNRKTITYDMKQKIDVYAYSLIYAALIEPIALDPPAISADDFFEKLKKHQRPVCKNANERQRKILEMMWNWYPNDRISFDQVIHYFEKGDLIFPETNLNEFNEYRKLCDHNAVDLTNENNTGNFECIEKNKENAFQITYNNAQIPNHSNYNDDKFTQKDEIEEDFVPKNHIGSKDEETIPLKSNPEENDIPKNKDNIAYHDFESNDEPKIFNHNNYNDDKIIQKDENEEDFVLENHIELKDEEKIPMKSNPEKNDIPKYKDNIAYHDFESNDELKVSNHNCYDDDKIIQKDNDHMPINEASFQNEQNDNEEDPSNQEQVIDLNNYDKNEKIGVGGFCKVYKITDRKTGEIYSAKILNKYINQNNNNELKDLIQEVSIISSFHHPTIIEFVGFSIIDFKRRPRPVIITKYYPNGSLKDIIIKDEKEWDQTKKLISIYGIASAILYMHSNNIIHRDLKPNNILSDNDLNPKVADFGLSTVIPKNTPGMSFTESTLCGTPEYIAPETWQNHEFSMASDVYAFSLIVYEIMTNEPPFPKNMTAVQIVYQITLRKLRPKIKKQVPSSYKQLIESCWNDDPNKRPSFKEIVSLLENDLGFITSKIDKKKFEEFIEKINGHSIDINEDEINLKKQRFEEYINKIKIILDQEEEDIPDFPKNFFKPTGSSEIIIEEEKSMQKKTFGRSKYGMHIDVNSDNDEVSEYAKKRYIENDSNDEDISRNDEKYRSTPYEDFVSEDFDIDSNDEEESEEKEEHKLTPYEEFESGDSDINSNDEKESEKEDDEHKSAPYDEFVSKNSDINSSNEETSENEENQCFTSNKESTNDNSNNNAESLDNKHQFNKSINFVPENENNNSTDNEMHDGDNDDDDDDDDIASLSHEIPNERSESEASIDENNSEPQIEIHYTNNNESSRLFKIGNLYYKKDEKIYFYLAKALQYYKKAAELGHTDAMNNAGLMLIEGKGTDVNKKLGIEYLAKAANKGNMIAMSNFFIKLKEGVDCSEFL